MKNLLQELGHKVGMDKAIAYTSGARIVQGLTGVLSVFFITTFLTGVEQGFYYTFGSILALQIFFELGLTGIMTQYVAHEASHLELDSAHVYHGEPKYQSRLASLVRFCIKWYTVVALVVFLFLTIFGQVYFGHYGDNQTEDVEWRSPWIFVTTATALQLFLSPFTAILRGLGFVKEMSKVQFWQQLIIPSATWIGLAVGMKLYITGLSHLLTVIIWLVFVWRSGLWTVLHNLLKVEVTERVHYFKEIFPYQWRIALSWVSGYFIFQLFNPVLFATEGAVVAGQMGMTLHVLNAILSLSLSWMNTKVPLYSKLIALKDYVQLDRIFNVTLRQMTVVCATLFVAFFVVLWVLKVTQLSINGNVFANRFLDFLPLLLMAVPVFLQQYIGSWATYLRCHKREPYLVNSVVGGVLCLMSTFFLGNAYGLYGVTLGYCTVQILLFPWGWYIYRTKKAEWHGPAPSS